MAAVENDVWSFTNPGGKWPMPMMGATVDNLQPLCSFTQNLFCGREYSSHYDVPA
jgi:hypothetical protein